jgi:hypothetical protein
MLVAAFSFVAVGCGGDDGDDPPPPPGGGGETVLLDLATHLQTFSVGDSNLGLILPGAKGFQKAGGVTAEIIAGDGGKKVVELSLSENWSGLDLLDSYFHFAAGDKISGKGKVTAGAPTNAEFVFNDKPGDWGTPLYQLQNAPNKDWEFDKVLTAAMITNIAAGDPKGIRIAGNNATADTFKFTIVELKVVRP